LTRPASGGYSYEAPSRRDRGSRMPADPNSAAPRSPVPIDDSEAKRAFRDILRWIGEDPDRDGLKDTPARMIRAYREYFAGYASDPEDALRTSF
jgi:GTP cyclohydrolase I